MSNFQSLNNVLQHLKQTFVGKDEIVDLLGICLVAGENAFLLGPPGTAKSAIVRMMASCIKDGNTFEYLLTRFTEPNEIFGPFDIRRLKEGELVTNTAGMMPEASLVFLDELFNANSAILNSLLTALNERIFRRGRETRKLPALMFVGASNALPADETLNALLDRFLVRIECGYVDTDRLEEVLEAGWQLAATSPQHRPMITPAEIGALQQMARQVDVGAIRRQYVGLIHTLRNTGISVSDRRAVRIQNLIAASAVLSGRTTAIPADLWVLRYVWDTREQADVLSGIVDNVIRDEDKTQAHPRAFNATTPDPETILAEVRELSNQWNRGNLTPAAQSILRDKLRYIHSRTAWIGNTTHKEFIDKEIDDLWAQILKTS